MCTISFTELIFATEWLTTNVIVGDLDLNFQGQTSETSKTVRACVKIRAMTFIEVDIRHQMASLFLLYSNALT